MSPNDAEHQAESALRFNIDAEELKVFLDDVNERLQALESGIMQLEQGADAETLQAVFRAAHTLKALASTVGHHAMAELTHTLETLFERLRDTHTAPTPAMADDLLATVDVLKALRDEVTTTAPSTADAEGMIARLRSMLDDESLTPVPLLRSPRPAQLTPQQHADVAQRQALGQHLFEVEITAQADAFAPGARLYQATLAVMEAGEIVSQHPSMEGIAEHDRQIWLLVALRTADRAPIEHLLSEVIDLASWSVRPLVIPAPRSPHDSVEHNDKTVRISVERLDLLMDLVGELVADRTRLMQIEHLLRATHGRDHTVSQLSEMAAHFGRVVDQLQTEVMRARMLPIAHLFDKFPRLVRDAARAAGKQVNLVIEGEATELDRSIIESIGDPLIHLLRNAVDHGIETPEERVAAGKPEAGTIRLRAAPVEGQIVITVEDDGRGIDPARVRKAVEERELLPEDKLTQMADHEAVNLIFMPNLSTASQVTEISGRGVGLDIVRTNVERLSGSVVVETEITMGTSFYLTLPLTLAIVQTMLIAVGENTYAIPLANIINALYLSEASYLTIKGRAAIKWRETVLPLLDLRDFFATHRPTLMERSRKPAVITVTWGKHQVGLVVDKIIGQQETVIKPLSTLVGRVPGLSGGAILGDGRVALIVDIPSLIEAALQSNRYGATA